ncbi:uncharacterized protein MONBRDRAFT_16483 [Monosiga brevicollis MX1]|uniref:Galactosylgalactosylxylosylprotein 3-beta-glucuronosyltransferase n=1 Tax=Monosiga brevicollis TaxID=81824 RepID=A9UWL9_MONBE|nr:uncharacterized protein MONBRDRAFT_16483 [Monosiga brevicollis MX1]EDQ90069.1 predicted protein [Monosiga brevicollis MX1]|eukprot:XP_001744836.1 hypothetical protein [Monosiga brevicollis MX1]
MLFPSVISASSQCVAPACLTLDLGGQWHGLHQEKQQRELVAQQQEQAKAALPTIYLVTPTYARSSQHVDLTRFCYTIRQVPKVHWIVVEDAEVHSPEVRRILNDCEVAFSHLVALTPPRENAQICRKVDSQPRGVKQRNTGLVELRRLLSLNGGRDGVVYFADDDNTYSLEIFERMRHIKAVGVWRVAFVGGLSYEGPVVDMGPNGPRISGWHVAWATDRKYPVDMAAFALNTRLITAQPDVYFPTHALDGHLETDFLSAVVPEGVELEPLGFELDRVLVWHTRTELPNLRQEGKLPPDRRPIII